jgi:hypothetical protein
MLLNNASTRAPLAEPVGQLSSMSTQQSSSSPSSTMDSALDLASQNSRAVGFLPSHEMRYGTSIQVPEPRRVSVLLSAQTVVPEISERRFERANILLERFRTTAVYFPYVIVPPTIDAETLLKERPFLYKSIMAAVEGNLHDQRDQVRDITQYLALHMMQLEERNLDMLLGLLVHIARYVCYVASD